MSNEVLNKVLAENIEKLSGGVEAAVDFTLEQAPEVISQALTWNMYLSAAECVFGLLWAVFLIVINLKLVTSDKFKNARGDDQCFIIALSLIATMFASTIGFVYINLTWLKIWIAPKVWLIEYAANLVK